MKRKSIELERFEFKDSAQVKSFIKCARYYEFAVGDTGRLKQEFDKFQFAFHKPECRAPVLTTKAGWAMLHDQNVIPPMFGAIQMLKQLGIDFKEIALNSFGLREGYWFVGADRWKSQPVGPGHGTDKDQIMHKCWQARNSLHADLREADEVIAQFT